MIKGPHTNTADVSTEKIKAAILAVNCVCITESEGSSHKRINSFNLNLIST